MHKQEKPVLIAKDYQNGFSFIPKMLDKIYKLRNNWSWICSLPFFPWTVMTNRSGRILRWEKCNIYSNQNYFRIVFYADVQNHIRKYPRKRHFVPRKKLSLPGMISYIQGREGNIPGSAILFRGKSFLFRG
ncbi:hypothetical protein [Gracilibacillus suaedae]|uniref:hypothetical protein n=1 Tax=Gracilibacillus suaedae TaxID=2820273 RepID=UPI001ABE80EA|nr:hypothetical protein [Gracilibacillus suaedae]